MKGDGRYGKFPFLIGRIKRLVFAAILPQLHQFPFLIGRIKSSTEKEGLLGSVRFPFLIGRIKSSTKTIIASMVQGFHSS